MTTKSTPERATSANDLDTFSADIGLLLLRVVFGGLLAAHGTQKLFGWFSGYGWSKNAAAFDSMGYNPGKLFGTLAGLSELTGGLLLLLGLLTPLAAAIVLGTMINAINTTWSGGLMTGKGYETALLFAVVGATIAFTGPGKFSLDSGRPWQRQGFVWGAGAVVLAVAAAVLTLILKWTL
ncbi:DoxX family protein [Nocardia sp. NBC_01009]|uniref:DoxX family protein n=1 Tax=Nocardia sp. NBC_01009 TaxID=2975996 RepID=UPI00386D3716|nr:DoxX family protein [Nocardia sp. NBC_01009]